MNKGIVRIYACGGAGTSITSHFESQRGQDNPGRASVETAYVDTSLSDVTENIPREHLFITDDTDGSGKVRAENNKLLKSLVPDILHKFKPGNVNVVVSSGSGGTGAVAAGYIAAELLERGEPTIVIVVGTVAARREIDNTIKTVKSYENTSLNIEKPIVMMYFQNDTETPRSVVDNSVRVFIERLSVLFSRQNRHLDNADLVNWLDYTRVTDIEPKLVQLDLIDHSDLANKDINIISIATLCNDGVDSTSGVPVEYQAVGYVPEGVFPPEVLSEPVHFCITDGAVAAIMKNLNRYSTTFMEHRRSKGTTATVLGDNERQKDDNLFL